MNPKVYDLLGDPMRLQFKSLQATFHRLEGLY